MKTLIVAISLFFGLAHAGDRSAAYNLICKPLPFDSDRTNCMNRIKNYSYFDDRALSICASFNFDSDKISCLDLIADKTYEAYEMDACASKTFESEKRQCLQDNGTRTGGPGGCLVGRDSLSQMRTALIDLRNGNAQSTDQRLSYLIQKYSNCVRP